MGEKFQILLTLALRTNFCNVYFCVHQHFYCCGSYHLIILALWFVFCDFKSAHQNCDFFYFVQISCYMAYIVLVMIID